MNVCVVGCGYVGFTAANCLASVGNVVYCVEKNVNKLAIMKMGQSPIYEDGMQPMLESNIKQDTIKFVSKLEEIDEKINIIFIAVGTPSQHDGAADLKYVYNAIDEVIDYVSRDFILVMKSTVPLGTGDNLKKYISAAIKSRGINCHYISNPEFLKEGFAIKDFMRPERIILGSTSKYAFALLQQLYEPFSRESNKFHLVSVADAELIKYASNCFLATKISFINELASIGDHFNCNINNIRKGMGADGRISNKFLYAGCGFGGSCFPKDLREFMHLSEKLGKNSKIVKAALEVNNEQKRKLFSILTDCFEKQLSGKVVALWGGAFKPGTDDIRESPSLKFIENAISSGVSVQIFDPQADTNINRWLVDNGYQEKATCVENQYLALEGADVLVITTEWMCFRSPDFDMIKSLLNTNLIIDGRNMFDPEFLNQIGIAYRGIGINNNMKLVVKSSVAETI